MAEPRSYVPLLRALLVPGLTEPGALDYREERREIAVQLDFIVHPDDVGGVIGKYGANLSSLRSLMEFAARRNGDRLTLNLLDG